MAEEALQNFLHTYMVLKVVSWTFLWCFFYSHRVQHWKHTNSSQSHLSNHLPSQLIWCLPYPSVYAPLGFVGMTEKFQKYQSASRKLSTESCLTGILFIPCPNSMVHSLSCVLLCRVSVTCFWRVALVALMHNIWGLLCRAACLLSRREAGSVERDLGTALPPTYISFFLKRLTLSFISTHNEVLSTSLWPNHRRKCFL